MGPVAFDGEPQLGGGGIQEMFDLLGNSYGRLQENVCELNIATQWTGLKINVDKTKTMVFGEVIWK